MDLLQVLPAVVVGVGGVVWAIRLEGRVNTHDAIFIEREKQTNQRKADQDRREADLDKRFDRVEAKIDTLLDRTQT